MAEQNIKLYSGNSKQIVVTVKYANGQEINLHEFNIYWALKPNSSSSIITVSKSVDKGITVLTANQFLIDIASHDTINLSGIYYQECFLTKGEKTHTIFTGQVVVNKSTVSQLMR
jgi:hypothetical protein